MNKYITDIEQKSLKRIINNLPDYIETALLDNSLLKSYKNRPAYQKNDYIGWITRAKREETKQKRLKQMLAELRNGELYMNMKW